MIHIPHVISGGLRRVTALSLAALLSASQLASAGQVVKFEGSFADVSGYDINGCTWFRLVVGRTATSATKAEPETFLNYDVYDVCGGWQLVASGTGVIPTSSFNSDGKNWVFAVTVTTTPTFQTTGPTGDISLTFTPDGVEKRVSSGHSRLTYLDRTNMLHGSWTTETASVSGTLLIAALVGASGNMGETRDLQIQIKRGSN